MPPDPKPAARVRNPVLLSNLHATWRECALCPNVARRWMSLHHISKHPRDDVEANLVMLCGSGTTGCHGLVEAGHRETRRRLGYHLLHVRTDVLPYLITKHETEERARAWISRNYYVE